MDRSDITWLRGAVCFEDNQCEAVARVPGQPGLFIVARTVTDPAALAAFSHRIGEGEVLVSVTDDLFPELNPC